MTNIIDQIKAELSANNSRLSQAFIRTQVSDSNITYLHPTPNTRICVIQTPSGHEVVGIAQVLDANNDVEEIGNKIALTNATNELWSVYGSIAKAVQ